MQVHFITKGGSVMRQLTLALLGRHGKNSTTALIRHVMRQGGKTFDYLVAACLKGFDRSMQVNDASLIVCKGDEYAANTIEKRPKFYLFPHTAIITGIAWNHFNLFPTYDFFLQSLRIFIDKFEPNGLLICNVTDEECVKLVKLKEQKRNKVPSCGVP